jgi:putative redox protein
MGIIEAMDSKAPSFSVSVKWEDGTRFSVANASGASQILDGRKESGLSPMESLAAAVCGCMSIDVVSILEKMRLEFRGLNVTAAVEQNPDHPRRVRKIHLTFTVEGAVPFERVERAVELSHERYCTVFHSLRKDIEFTHLVKIVE